MSIPIEYVFVFAFIQLGFVCTACVVAQTVIYVKDCIRDYKFDKQVLEELREEYQRAVEHDNANVGETVYVRDCDGACDGCAAAEEVA